MRVYELTIRDDRNTEGISRIMIPKKMFNCLPTLNPLLEFTVIREDNIGKVNGLEVEDII